MKDCVITPQVKNKNGEFVDSELFSSLLKFTGNRELAKKYYYKGTDPTFLSMVANRARFDNNNEITISSLIKLGNIDLKEDRIIEELNRDISAGIYEYNLAIPKLQSFNRDNLFNDTYLATLSLTDDNKVELKIVKKTNSNVSLLNDLISNRSLLDRIKFYLNRAGVDYTFLDKDSGINGRYSTANAVKTADSVYLLIKVANNESIDSSLSEEAGHFAVGALGESPLVKRLESLLTPEVLKSIMGEEYSTIQYRKNPAREVAGYLVGKAINNEIDKRFPWRSLVDRIVNLVKRIFNSITGNELANAKLESIRTAEIIALGFMSTSFLGNVELALLTKETLYSAKDSINVSTFKSILNVLKNLAAEMRAINKNLYDRYRNLEGLVEMGRLSDSPSIFADIIAVDGILEAIDLTINNIPDIIRKLDSIDFLITSITPENATILREVATFVNNALALIKIVKDATTKHDSRLKLSNVNEEVIDKLIVLRRNLNEAINGDNRLLDNLEIKQREFFLKFLEDAYGSQYINRASRIIFNWKKGQKGLRWVSALKVPIEDLLRYMESDISIFESLLASMSNSSDIIGLLADRSIKLANKYADDLTVLALDDLRVLLSDLKKIGVEDTSIFCEISPRTGKLTGNIISDKLWGDYEDDWILFKKESKDKFLELTDLSGKSDFEKSILWNLFFKPLAKSWHKAHSEWDQNKRRYIPNSSYDNPEYNRLGNEKIQWLNKYMEFKSKLDSLLPEGSTNPVRMPLFKGTTMNKIRNRNLTDNLPKSLLYTLRRNIADTFVEDSEDRDFGSDLTYNTIEEDMFSNLLEFEKEKINRVPLYGINKLKDSAEISTDLFQSTLAYAGMAYTFAAISSVSGTLEIGKEVLLRRAVSGIKSENNRYETSRAYRRYLKFLDKQVYGINTPKIKLGNKIVVNKIAGFFTGLASKIFLGGNVAGGAINLGTGSLEVFKEAIAGEHFNLKDWKKANLIYWKYLPSNWINAGEDIKEDKVSLFIRRMNSLNDSKKRERDFFTRKSRLLKMNPVGENLFLPYKAGEHYMQTIGYISLAVNTKLFDEKGNPISLWDSLIVTSIDENNPKAGKTLSIREDVRIVDSKTGESREWNTEDEARLIDKAREINNRMHGIYNDLDKVAFQLNIFGNALLAMRGYALGMIQRRLGANIYSTTLDTDSEGTLISLSKVIASTFTDKGGFGLTARAIFLPVSLKVKLLMLDAGFSANLYYNMRRNWADMLVIAALSLLKILTAKPDDEDDEEDNLVTGIAYYTASRLYSELAAFNTPWGFVKEIPVVTNISPVGFSLATDIVNITTLVATQEEYLSNGATYEKGDLKWLHKVERLLPYYRSFLLLQNPYQASLSYLYGRANIVR